MDSFWSNIIPLKIKLSFYIEVIEPIIVKFISIASSREKIRGV